MKLLDMDRVSPKVETSCYGTRSLSLRLMNNKASLVLLQRAAVEVHIVPELRYLDNALTQATRHV